MRVLTVVGARPQFIKSFAVSRAIRSAHEEVVVHTGQHYDESLSAVFFDEFDLPEPDHHLGVGSGSHGHQTAAIMRAFEPVLTAEQPDVVVVYGDTNSTLAAAIVASKHDTLLAHVEAGLRSRNREMPEEINRVATDHVSDLLCAPTLTAVENLTAEGLADRTIHTGDVMVDTLAWAREMIAEGRVTAPVQLAPKPYVLVTVHRAANTDDPDRLEAIVDALLAREEPMVFPMHPRTEEALERTSLLDAVTDSVTVTDPVSYLEFVGLLDAASAVVTDSGGVQKEAFLLDTPCVTLRGETEWGETVDYGWNVLVDADPARIHRALDRDDWPSPIDKAQPYGSGTAAEAIVDALEVAVDGPTVAAAPNDHR